MIRDPSDGSVRERPPIETGTSGLPVAKPDAKETARLENAREWLKNYLHRKPEGTDDPHQH
jgi:hypothetical protein